jgi:hypothetical protein
VVVVFVVTEGVVGELEPPVHEVVLNARLELVQLLFKLDLLQLFQVGQFLLYVGFLLQRQFDLLRALALGLLLRVAVVPALNGIIGFRGRPVSLADVGVDFEVDDLLVVGLVRLEIVQVHVVVGDRRGLGVLHRDVVQSPGLGVEVPSYLKRSGS